MQLSTVISDGALAVVSLAAAGTLLVRRPGTGWLAGLGFLIVGVAATLGSVRFAGVDAVIPAHDGLSACAAAVGLPAIGLAWLARGYGLPLMAGWWAVVACAAVAVIAYVMGQDGWTMVAGTWAMASVIAGSIKVRGLAGAMGTMGAVTTALAGLVIGSEGQWLGQLRVDWFHAALLVANLLLAGGLYLSTDSRGGPA